MNQQPKFTVFFRVQGSIKRLQATIKANNPIEAKHKAKTIIYKKYSLNGYSDRQIFCNQINRVIEWFAPTVQKKQAQNGLKTEQDNVNTAKK